MAICQTKLFLTLLVVMVHFLFPLRNKQILIVKNLLDLIQIKNILLKLKRISQKYMGIKTKRTI